MPQSLRPSTPIRISLVILLVLVVASRGKAADKPPGTLVAPFSAAQAADAQQEWAVQLGVKVRTENSLGMTLTLIPPAEFVMGSTESPEAAVRFAIGAGLPKSKPADFADEYPPHTVRLTRPFRVASCEVTRAAFAAFVRAADYRTDAEADGKGGWGWDEMQQMFRQDVTFNWRNVGFEQTAEHPVLNVSWNDARRFCEWLSSKERRQYRLPTEAEWEFINRAGSQSRYQCGDDPESLAQIANVADAAARTRYPQWPAILASDGYVYTSPVGSFRPNAFGLYDLHGNVWEWCDDIYEPDWYSKSPVDDPIGPRTGAWRVSRGGAWSRTTVNCRSAVRRRGEPTLRHINLGFRPVLTLD